MSDTARASSGGSPKLLLGTALSIAAAIAAAPLQAQAVASASSPERICAVFAGEANSEGAQTVYAGCWGTGLVLGEAEQFEAKMNLDLKATLVRLEHHGTVRVLLLRALPDGRPIVEDVGSVLASAAGRSPLGGIDGLALDFTAFETNGKVGVQETRASVSAPVSQVQRQAVSGAGASVTANEADIGAMIAQNAAVDAAVQAAP